MDHNGRAVRREGLRNDDGTFRKKDSSKQATRRSIIAHWVEEEVALRRRFADGSFAKITALVVEAARKQILPRVPLPAGVKFPDNYTLSGRGALKAFARYRARAKPNWANRKASNSNVGDETATSSQGQRRNLPNQPLRLVRLQLRPRTPFSEGRAGDDLDLGTFDLGGLSPKDLEALEEWLCLISAIELETSTTRTTLRPDVIYTADPNSKKYDDI
jgi:hypothetical protein